MNTAETEQIFKDELYRLPQKVIVLIPVPWENISEDQVTQLEKILNYVKLNLAAVQILHKNSIAIGELTSFNPSIILSFGTPLHPPSKVYEQNLIEGVPVIYSEALGSLGDSEKRNLMGVLKQAFKL